VTTNVKRTDFVGSVDSRRACGGPGFLVVTDSNSSGARFFVDVVLVYIVISFHFYLFTCSAGSSKFLKFLVRMTASISTVVFLVVALVLLSTHYLDDGGSRRL
jgi:hypothetical protein